jgi:hypothetical protein
VLEDQGKGRAIRGVDAWFLRGLHWCWEIDRQ